MGAKDKAAPVVKAKPVFTKEEELLLQDFSRNVSTKSNALFYGNAFIVSAIPICKYSYLLCICKHISSQSLKDPILIVKIWKSWFWGLQPYLHGLLAICQRNSKKCTSVIEGPLHFNKQIYN